MFEASVDGEAFDMERWGQYYKPAGATGSGGGRSNDAEADVAAVDAAPKISVETKAQDPAPWEDAPSAPAAKTAGGGSERAQDILAAIRARQNKSE
jgi:hypothetical protein